MANILRDGNSQFLSHHLGYDQYCLLLIPLFLNSILTAQNQ